MSQINRKIGVILFNLGGPDKLESVRPFLFNLFNDKAIISLPQPLRWMLAKIISNKREKKAQGIYAQMNGKSPILDITLSQADSLERELSFHGDFKVFTIMRYWHPFAKDVVKKINEYRPDEIILLPLYPQFSSTTSASSIKDFGDNFTDSQTPIKIICCYPLQDDFIKSHVANINQTLNKIPSELQSQIRLLFSAHGLPQKIIDNGDPYVFQVESTVKSTMEKLENLRKVNCQSANNSLDYAICYQSKVGPLKWTTPSLEHEIRRASLDRKIPVIIPIAFVSDHSETLVELDIEYKELSAHLGIEHYYRVPALNIERNFITAMTKMVLSVAKNNDSALFCGEGKQRICPKKLKLCPNPHY